MTSKSRLGKGLGALFPALPGDPNANKAEEVEKSKVQQPEGAVSSSDVKQSHPANVSRETSDIMASGISQREHIDNVSRETSHDTKSDVKAARNVSRETKKGRGHNARRMNIPSINEMAHPSDLFFGAGSGIDADTHVDAVKDNLHASEHEDVHHMASVVNDAVKELGLHADQLSKKVSATAVTTEEHKKIKQAIQDDVSRETSLEAASADNAHDASNSKEDNIDNGLKPVKGGYLTELKLSDIGPNKEQPRTIFDEDELRELADSIREVGVLQPIVVRKRPDNQQSSDADEKQPPYELIMGERRWRASRLAGLDSIPAIVKTTTDDHMLRDALLENLHRVALNPLEEAAAYQQMIDEFGLTQAQLSESVSKSRPQIANTLRLLNLPGSIQKKVAAGVLSAGHARALLGLSNEEEMEKLANRIIAEGLSVRSTEEIVAMKTTDAVKTKRERAKVSNPWADSPIRQNLEQRFDTKVAIKGNQKHGRIEIAFSSPDDMQRILDLLMPEQKDGDNSPVDGSAWV